MKLYSLWKGEIIITVPCRSMREILADIARIHQVHVRDILGSSRQRWVAWPRQEAMWVMSQQVMEDGSPRYSLPQIGGVLGRDHSTVVHGLKVYAKRNGIKYDGRKAGQPRWTYMDADLPQPVPQPIEPRRKEGVIQHVADLD